MMVPDHSAVTWAHMDEVNRAPRPDAVPRDVLLHEGGAAVDRGEGGGSRLHVD